MEKTQSIAIGRRTTDKPTIKTKIVGGAPVQWKYEEAPVEKLPRGNMKVEQNNSAH